MFILEDVNMNRLSLQDRARILGCLTEGTSMRSASRLVDVSINTVTKLLVDVGTACSDYQDQVMRNLPCQTIECDEIWTFCYAKARNVPEEKYDILGYGDVWTWTAICADTKLVPSFLVGKRDAGYGKLFIDDLASRLKYRVQLTTDSHKSYIKAIRGAFGNDIDYAQLVKLYGQNPGPLEQRRYSPSECTGTRKKPMIGDPDPAKVSTSYVERQNLSMRMGMRRFTRLTNGFSKKIENHAHAVAIYYMHYNFARIHKTLRVTPAMAAGISDHVWTLEEIAKLAD